MLNEHATVQMQNIYIENMDQPSQHNELYKEPNKPRNCIVQTRLLWPWFYMY